MSKLKVGIIGTRGIPNEYGGFEQFTHYFAPYLAEEGVDVTVYCTKNHSYQQEDWKGVKLKHIWNPEGVFGPFGQFIYDLGSIWHSRKQNFDVLLQLGYTSSSIWSFLMPKRTKVATNMDGLEWKRSKYNPMVQKFLKLAEKWAVNSSDVLISDSKGIQNYLTKKHHASSVFIPYAATPYTPDTNKAKTVLEKYKLKEKQYNLLIARFEPENNIEMVIKAFVESGRDDLYLIGNYTNNYGMTLYEKYKDQVHFMGAIYDQDALSTLRYCSNFYFHGHSVGGTNPSLLEAMACSCTIVAHDNEFNRSVLEDNAFYFKNFKDIDLLLKKKHDFIGITNFIACNLKKINTIYSFKEIHEKYLGLLVSLSNEKTN